jgi:adenylate cyclase
VGTNQFGFADLPVDIDQGGAVRRALLFLWDGDTPYLSFPLRLALRYLTPDGLSVTPAPDQPDFVRIGETTIPRFNRNDGAYIDQDAGGYQFLLDYREGTNAYPTFTFGQVARGEVPDAAFRDRVVILGTITSSVKDRFSTPFNREGVLMPGIEVHGHAVSQLIRYAYGESKPLAVTSERSEALWVLLWVLLWACLGTLLGLWNRGPLLQVLVMLAGLAGLVVFAYQLFLHGTWIAVIAPALAGASAAGLASLYVGVRSPISSRASCARPSPTRSGVSAKPSWMLRVAASRARAVSRSRRCSRT